MTIPEPVVGWGALLIALYLTCLAPPGRRGRNAIIGSVAVAALVFTAAWFLWPADNWLLPAVVASLIAIVIRDVRRWVRYFRNLSYRMRHPYYWYSRLSRRRRARA